MGGRRQKPLAGFFLGLFWLVLRVWVFCVTRVGGVYCLIFFGFGSLGKEALVVSSFLFWFLLAPGCFGIKTRSCVLTHTKQGNSFSNFRFRDIFLGHPSIHPSEVFTRERVKLPSHHAHEGTCVCLGSYVRSRARSKRNILFASTKHEVETDRVAAICASQPYGPGWRSDTRDMCTDTDGQKTRPPSFQFGTETTLKRPYVCMSNILPSARSNLPGAGS